ncbi:MAG: 9-O-acetylesterase [Planctomycetes bacterium]|nr:9-O-acetylesterase [Planctomycetota bacterium]
MTTLPRLTRCVATLALLAATALPAADAAATGAAAKGAAPVAAATPAVAVKPLLHPLFSDHAVLQRGKPVTLWGWAKPGSQVVAGLTGPGIGGAPATVTAAADGRWQAQLGPFQACKEPCTLTVSSDGQTAVAKDLLIGEVWLCSGQSNMEWIVKNSRDAEQEAKDANHPGIRHIAIGKAQVADPVELVKGEWKVCAPDSVPWFTAVGYFFGRHLHQELQVPIGLVHSSWGGTPAEAWTSQEVLKALPDHTQSVEDFRKLAAEVAEQTKRTGKDYNTLLKEWYEGNDPGSKPNAAKVPAWADAGFDDSAWTAATLPSLFEDAKAIPANWDGTVWVRRTVTVPEALAGKPAKLVMGKITDWDTTYINGRQVGGTEQPWRGRDYNVPAKVLKAGDNVIAIRILDTGGKVGGEGKDADYQLRIEGAEPIALGGAWKIQTGVEKAKAPALPVRTDRVHGPGSLYNGMIAPLVPMAFAGAIWYQGESNSGRAYQYRTLLPAMINDWRARFGQGDFPFYIVQLANYMEPAKDPGDSAWAELREAQALTAANLKNCGMAVIIDVGEAKDIHPKNKQDVGKRLALQALAKTYGKPVVASGPVYQGMKVDGSSVRVSFTELGGGLAVRGGGELTGFTLAGEDRKFQWAQARIDGDAVVVSAAAVTKPVAVRYAWTHNPDCNLVNKAGLPAGPFRSDDWPGATWPKELQAKPAVAATAATAAPAR